MGETWRNASAHPAVEVPKFHSLHLEGHWRISGVPEVVVRLLDQTHAFNLTQAGAQVLRQIRRTMLLLPPSSLPSYRSCNAEFSTRVLRYDLSFRKDASFCVWRLLARKHRSFAFTVRASLGTLSRQRYRAHCANFARCYRGSLAPKDPGSCRNMHLVAPNV